MKSLLILLRKMEFYPEGYEDHLNRYLELDVQFRKKHFHSQQGDQERIENHSSNSAKIWWRLTKY